MRLGSFYSWTILDQDTIVKNTDKSVFVDGGSVLPVETRWFWGLQTLAPGDEVYLTLVLGQGISNEYEAVVSPNNGRLRMYWRQLKPLLRRLFPMYQSFSGDDYPAMIFQRLGNSSYAVSFSEETIYLPPRDLPELTHGMGREEGRIIYIHSKARERNDANRKECIRIHGVVCKACGFDFGKTYGKLGKGYVEVHHRQAVHTFDKIQLVNPATDLVPVCANCHRMLHRKRDNAISVEELRELIIRSRIYHDE